MYLFASIMKKDKGYKTMAFTITACNSAIYDNSMKTEVVCKVGYKEMIQLIKDGYRSPLFDTRKLKSLVDMRLKRAKDSIITSRAKALRNIEDYEAILFLNC